MSFVVIADNIRSAHNVGSIFRTSDGAGADKLFLVGTTPTPSTKETVYLTRAHKDLAKTALGAENNIPWESYETMEEVLAKLKRDGYSVVALEQSEGSVDYRSYEPTEKVALVVGYEVDGVYTPVEYRGHGFAHAVVWGLVEACGHDTLYMHSIKDLTGFYSKHGFVPIDEHELPPTIQERYAWAQGEMEGADVCPMKRTPVPGRGIPVPDTVLRS